MAADARLQFDVVEPGSVAHSADGVSKLALLSVRVRHYRIAEDHDDRNAGKAAPIFLDDSSA